MEVSFESGFETNPLLLHSLCIYLTLLLHESSVYSRTGVAGGGCRSTAQFFPLIQILRSFAGAEGELQLRFVLPTREWESREILGRGTSPRRLSVQRARRILGGKYEISSLYFDQQRFPTTEEIPPLNGSIRIFIFPDLATVEEG